MKFQIDVTLSPEDEKNTALINKIILEKTLEKLSPQEKKSFNKSELKSVFVKKSIDARRGKVKFHLRYDVYIGEDPSQSENALPLWKKADGKKSVIIVGSGPAGLFGALKLLESGIKPIIIERGSKTDERKRDIAAISTKDTVNPNSNYCFGEGGAGTFSDGKLYTRSNKRGNIQSVLQIFNYFGADKKILTDAHPHIGTDRLPQIINAMRNKIIECGGEVHFNSLVTDFIIEQNATGPVAKGVIFKNTKDESENQITADCVLVATGHSASDIYSIFARRAPDCLEAKTFAAGVRVEHPRELIDSIQFHGRKSENLGAAEYRLTTQVDGRGVYSFCMCPGGFVVSSSSSADEIVVNGMSAAKRNSRWSNAAIVVEIRPEDIPQEFTEAAKKMGCAQLAGLLFRSKIEQDAKINGNGQAAPAQRLKDFLANKKSKDLPASSFTAGLVSSNLGEWLPKQISERLKKGFEEFNKNMKGFICDDALLIAPETRTSTPVRITRDADSLECTALRGLYPAGEGSGYSGGIVSSAMDGIRCCEKIAEKLKS